MGCVLKDKYDDANQDVYKWKNNGVDYCVDDQMCKSFNMIGNVDSDKFMETYCAYKLNDYMHAKTSGKFNINDPTKYYSKEFNTAFDPKEWSTTFPQCSCYGHDGYVVYEAM